MKKLVTTINYLEDYVNNVRKKEGIPEKRYSVGFISSSALHGAAHQQPIDYLTITEKPAVRETKKKYRPL